MPEIRGAAEVAIDYADRSHKDEVGPDGPIDVWFDDYGICIRLEGENPNGDGRISIEFDTFCELLRSFPIAIYDELFVPGPGSGLHRSREGCLRQRNLDLKVRRRFLGELAEALRASLKETEERLARIS